MSAESLSSNLYYGKKKTVSFMNLENKQNKRITGHIRITQMKRKQTVKYD